MKKCIIYFLILFTSISYSCSFEELNQETNLVKDFNEIEKDHRYLTILKENLDFSFRAKNSLILKELLDKGDLNYEDLELVALELGFENKSEFESHLELKSKIYRELIQEYNLQTVDPEIFLEKNKLLLNEISQSNENLRILSGCNCERLRVNCIIETAAIATGLHVACIAADLTVALGVICHSAAYTYQIVASDTCNANAENCEVNCVDLI